MNETGSTSAANTFAVKAESGYSPKPDPERPVGNLFRAEYVRGNVLRLTPLNDLAAHLLGQWLGGEVKRTAHCHGRSSTSEHRYGQSIECMDFEFSSRPMLSSGNDPYWTGMSLSPEEAKAARQFIDGYRLRKETERSKKLAKIIKPSATIQEMADAGVSLSLTPKRGKRKPTE